MLAASRSLKLAAESLSSSNASTSKFFLAFWQSREEVLCLGLAHMIEKSCALTSALPCKRVS